MTANPFAEATARALLDAVAAQSGERLAMVFGDERVTFARFRQRVETLARGLSATRSWSGSASSTGTSPTA